jgi:hypothetical protein
VSPDGSNVQGLRHAGTPSVPFQSKEHPPSDLNAPNSNSCIYKHIENRTQVYMNFCTRNSRHYHILKYLLFLLKHPVYCTNKRYLKHSRYRPEQAQRVDRGTALPFRDLGARRGCVVSITPRPLYPWERPGTHCTKGCVDPGPVWTCEKCPPTGIFFVQFLYEFDSYINTLKMFAGVTETCWFII